MKKKEKEYTGHQNWCNYYKFPGCRTLGCHPCNCGYNQIIKNSRKTNKLKAK